MHTSMHAYIHTPLSVSPEQDYLPHSAIKFSYYAIQFKVNVKSSVHVNDAVGKIKHLLMVMVTKANTLYRSTKIRWRDYFQR